MTVVAERAVAADEVVISETRAVPLGALRALYDTTTWANGRNATQLRALLRHSDLFLTAWDDTTLIGSARVVTDFVMRALICDVVVAPAYQGLGIGRLLVEAIEEHPALLEVEMLCLFTTQKRDFYAHLGWEEHPGQGMMLRRNERHTTY